MKRHCALFLCMVLCLPTACVRRTAPVVPDPSETEILWTAQDIAFAAAESQHDGGGLRELSGDVLTGYLNALGLIGWEDAAVLTGQGMDGREITVVKLADEAGAKTAAQCLEDHRQARIRDFFGYAPAQTDMLENAQVLVRGNYAVFLAVDDADAARQAFAACFEGGEALAHTVPEPSDGPEQTPGPDVDQKTEPAELGPDLDISGFAAYRQPGEVDMTLYDDSAVVHAWNTGDETGLSDQERAILNVCRAAFDAVIAEGMSDYEKELALHDWLMSHGRYDDLSRDNTAHIGRPHNTDPYGVLVGGYGICLGFAVTFQLLMDLAGVECITVVGAAYSSSADHAWNMVRLDGEWYCVDVTWNNSYEDVGGGEQISHRYFNVTSAVLRENDHQWDYLNIPEAFAVRYRWSGTVQQPDETERRN